VKSQNIAQAEETAHQESRSQRRGLVKQRGVRLTPKLPLTKKSRRGKVAHSLRIVRMYLLGTLLASTTSCGMNDSSAVVEYQQCSDRHQLFHERHQCTFTAMW
jgi:hypothetical protein